MQRSEDNSVERRYSKMGACVSRTILLAQGLHRINREKKGQNTGNLNSALCCHGVRFTQTLPAPPWWTDILKPGVHIKSSPFKSVFACLSYSYERHTFNTGQKQDLNSHVLSPQSRLLDFSRGRIWRCHEHCQLLNHTLKPLMGKVTQQLPARPWENFLSYVTCFFPGSFHSQQHLPLILQRRPRKSINRRQLPGA